jgi:hypothetical protein
MIQTLVNKGWSKNEVIYEMQRVFGNDVLILAYKLDDDRTFLQTAFFPTTFFGFTFGLLMLRRRRLNRLNSNIS